MALNHPQDGKPEEAHWEFLGVVRKFDMEEKLDQPLPELYTTHGTFGHTFHHAYPEEAEDDFLKQLKEQRAMGVMVNDVWSAQAGQVACLAQYCGFRDAQELTAYVDMIVPDIVHEAAFIASNPAQVNNKILSAEERFSLKFIKDNRFYDLGGPNWKGRVDQYGFSEKFVKPKPIDLIRSYQKQPEVREFVNYIVEYCPQPTFVPVRKWHLLKVHKQTFKHKAFELSPEAFVLSHAVQVLLFASQDFRPHRVYSRDSAKYEHRFPTPEFIGGGRKKVVAGLFSMEDLHRAILLFYYLVRRRKQDNWVGMVPEDNDLNFPGYHEPDTGTAGHFL
ncbi:hypothetical protein NW752_004277 [Fusarium irregulare]|uniref:Uncharacterized protein n=1 Tax=Fusarium irregulare TaxID=2494466 RepID=A0A9W8PPK2_9HYPO|nr:hypothetical protein NW766_007180 [Fusarium irregulare]KAJ4021270.1 hypothetical protein NW752_004277 [Fusarium irregulare]